MEVHIGLAPNSDSELACDALIHAGRVVFLEPTEADLSRSRWARADVVCSPEGQHMIDRREGVAVICVPVPQIKKVLEDVPDPVVIVIVPEGCTKRLPKRCTPIKRYEGACYSIRCRFGQVSVVELSRPKTKATEPAPVPARALPRKERRKRSRKPKTAAPTPAAAETSTEQVDGGGSDA